VADNYATPAGTNLVITAPGLLVNDYDPEGDAIYVTSVNLPTHGNIISAVTNGAFTYAPDPGFTGTDQFTYIFRDANSNFSDPVTVTIEVLPPFNRKPIGVSDHYSTQEGTNLVVSAPGLLANDLDPDGDAIYVTSVNLPAHGNIISAVTNGAFTYAPNPGFTGTDQFTYIFRDANNNFSDPVTVTIEVVFAENQPVGTEDNYAIEAGHNLVVAAPGLLANDYDPEGDAIYVTSVNLPTHGNIISAVTNGAFTYAPDPGFTGTDQFTYIFRDANSNFSDPVTVTIEVLPPFNRKPVGVADNYATPAGTNLVITAPGLLANDLDPDGDAIYVTSVNLPTHGNIISAVTNGAFTYAPNAGFTGTDQFTYIFRDANSNFSDPVTVTIEVIHINKPPIASAADVTTECTGPSGTPVTLDGSASSDPDNDIVSYTWYENSVVIAGPSASPTTELSLPTGIHTITLVVEDGCGNTSSDDATVKIEDNSPPLVKAAFLPTDQSNDFEISCSSEDVCTSIISHISVIRIPQLNSPAVSLKNQSNYSLEIDMEKNTVSVKAPDAAAFWAAVLSNGGVEVQDGQVIKAKYDKNKYKFGFDAQGNLISVEGNIVTLRCSATDANGNTGVSEATLPVEQMQTSQKSVSTDGIISDRNDLISYHQNYPNPFNAKTLIRFKLNIQAQVSISIYDQTGRLVQELSSKQMPAGIHQISWDATGQKPGIYYYRILYNNYQVSGKMIYIQ